MAEVLFQHEIDSLIESLASGDINPENYSMQASSPVKSFDFNRPNKFSKDQLLSLEIIHNNFARMLSNFLSAYLRTNIRIRVVTVEQLTYEDFVSSIPSPTLITVFSLEPLKRTAVFEANMLYVFPVLELLFGGKGAALDKVRTLTEIEMSVIKKLHGKILEIFGAAWQDIYEIKANIESMETNPRFSQSITPKETVVVISFETFIGKTNGLINFCIPFNVLDPVISRLSAHYWLIEGLGSPDIQETSYVEKMLAKVKVDLSAIVGEVGISARDFLQLQAGDVLQLNRQLDTDLDLCVGKSKKFKVRPGVVGNRLAVQIASEVEGD